MVEWCLLDCLFLSDVFRLVNSVVDVVKCFDDVMFRIDGDSGCVMDDWVVFFEFDVVFWYVNVVIEDGFDFEMVWLYFDWMGFDVGVYSLVLYEIDGCEMVMVVEVWEL